MKSKEALAKQCNYLFNEFLTNNKKYKTLTHFRRTPGGWLIMLKIFENYFKAGNYLGTTDSDGFSYVKYYNLNVTH